MGRIEKGFEMAPGSFVVKAVIIPAWGRSPGSAVLEQLMKASIESP